MQFKSNDRFAKARTVKLSLPQEMYVYDVRGAKALGRQKEVSVTLDPYEPAIFAASPEAFGDLELNMPMRLRRGETAQIGFHLARPSPAATHVFHVDVIDPAGKTVDYYSGNIMASHGHTAKLVPFAFNDAQGKWTVRAKDLLSGQVREGAIEVE